LQRPLPLSTARGMDAAGGQGGAAGGEDGSARHAHADVGVSTGLSGSVQNSGGRCHNASSTRLASRLSSADSSGRQRVGRGGVAAAGPIADIVCIEISDSDNNTAAAAGSGTVMDDH